jgi:hypothetical protein
VKKNLRLEKGERCRRFEKLKGGWVIRINKPSEDSLKLRKYREVKKIPHRKKKDKKD